MTATRHRLTPELQQAICGFILSGGYPHVAAEAAGLPREVFDCWLRRGAGARPSRKYRLFREAILSAQAQARLAAESRVMDGNPLAWLKHGPGRDTPDQPGWSNPPRAMPVASEAVSLLLHQQTQELIATLLRLLQPYPEVRAAVAEALTSASGGHELPEQADSGGSRPPLAGLSSEQAAMSKE
jgi:hypothetical protein